MDIRSSVSMKFTSQVFHKCRMLSLLETKSKVKEIWANFSSKDLIHKFNPYLKKPAFSYFSITAG